MFPLKSRKIGGFTFRQPYPASFGSLAGHPHLGVDYSANYVDLFMPFTGKITIMVGAQGGNTIWVYPDGQDIIIRLMHLSQMVQAGNYKEGDKIGVTGNSGSATTSPHLHCDISKHALNINDINNFLDPEGFNWEDNMISQMGITNALMEARKENNLSLTDGGLLADSKAVMEGDETTLANILKAYHKAGDLIHKSECPVEECSSFSSCESQGYVLLANGYVSKSEIPDMSKYIKKTDCDTKIDDQVAADKTKCEAQIVTNIGKKCPVAAKPIKEVKVETDIWDKIFRFLGFKK